eukprot:TRINITY_DN207_c0_g1_i1.p1 TRINITY_DN207_c0_g1~~TRINITY_DN207_c0_g1_i1.p1  ORF type:complete len:547 (-),score=139.83 TRINITY_DN207_c0_g1_i1:1346-2986(-)
MSPELFQNRPYSYKSDIWSLGCVLYEICNQRHAFDAQSINGLAMKILRGSYPPINAGYSKPLKDLIVKMLSVKPKERPNIVEIIQKPFIRKKVVEYLNECINMSQQPLDPTVVDDVQRVQQPIQMYVEGLKEQAAQLGIVEVLNQSTSVPFPIIKKEEGKALGSTEKNKKQSGDASKKVEDKKKPVEKYKGLKAKLKEKQKMEENLAALKKERKRRLEEFKLKLKKNVKKHETPIKSREKINESIDKKSKPTESIKEEQDTKIGKPPVHNKKSIKTELEEKPYHRLNNAEFNKVFQRKMKHRNTSIEPKSKKAEASTSHSGHATGSSSEEPAIDQKEKILREKEQRKKEEREKIEKALQQIRFENYIARQKAKEKEAEMLRPSSGMKHSLSISNNREGKAQTKIEEQYGMEEEQQEGEEGEEELEDIQEEMEEHEYDKDEFKEELHSLKTMSIQMKTIKTQLKEQCEKIVQDLNGIVIPEEPEKPQKNEEENIEGILDYLAEDSQEEEEEEEVKEEPEAPEKHKLIERIGLLKQYKLPSNYKKQSM